MSHDALTKLLAHADRLNGGAERIPLMREGTLEETGHWLDASALDALIAAVASDRPLLVLGEPGVGKSQLAQVAAKLMERPLMSTVIQPQTEYEELLWSIDLTRRLSEAHLRRASGITHADQTEDTMKQERDIDSWLAIERFICPGPLWYAFEPDYKQLYPTIGFQPEPPIGTAAAKDKDVVLLIDEIDKADISLCNGLLEVLGNREFHVPPIGRYVGRGAARSPSPLIIITSNNTRDLPPAFIRRCAVLTLSLPEKDLATHFVTIAKAAQKNTELSDTVLRNAANKIVEERNDTMGQTRAGQAEYLDLIRALDTVAKEGRQPEDYLSRLARYFRKQL